MRSEKEKKSITKSIKLSPLQVQQIEEKAVEIRHFILLSCMMRDRLGVIIMSGRNL